MPRDARDLYNSVSFVRVIYKHTVENSLLSKIQLDTIVLQLLTVFLSSRDCIGVFKAKALKDLF
jgi:hypothetical protein